MWGPFVPGCWGLRQQMGCRHPLPGNRGMKELAVTQLPGKSDGPSTANELGGAGGLRPVGFAPHSDRHGGIGLLCLHTERFGRSEEHTSEIQAREQLVM